MRIAFLEDDRPQADMIRGWLTDAGHQCVHHASAATFLREIWRESFDLMILDWELPESSGIEVLRTVRAQSDWRIPVLFLTNRDNEQDIVAALNEGADDYVVKPASRPVTLARIEALARRSRDETIEQRMEFGVYLFNTRKNTVMRSGEAVDLTEKEYQLASMLFSNIGRLLSRNHLLESVWGVGPELATRTVDTHVSRLRRKLALLPENGWRLKAVYQHGYRLERISEE
ncbi:MAG: response regulator transcription factor [Gammaproteobacteria bacterium]|nr:response regulator transcription factor [Gammaproteobacteria bacterium]